jgi:hypothetical protein
MWAKAAWRSKIMSLPDDLKVSPGSGEGRAA